MSNIKLDSEAQRSLLIAALETFPIEVNGPVMARDVIRHANEISATIDAVKAATIYIEPALDAMTER